MRSAAVIAISLLLLAAAGCVGGGAPPASAVTELPDLKLDDLDGVPVSIAGDAGEVRLVSFWATWCAPCREEIPTFKELEAVYGPKGFKIVGIAMDDEGVDVVKPFVEKLEIDYLNLIGNDEVATAFGVVGYPSTFLADRQGKIVKAWPYLVPKSVLAKEIEALLAS